MMIVRIRIYVLWYYSANCQDVTGDPIKYRLKPLCKEASFYNNKDHGLAIQKTHIYHIRLIRGVQVHQSQMSPTKCH
jgi:hypothetical protein